jgi:hypothetical protein
MDKAPASRRSIAIKAKNGLARDASESEMLADLDADAFAAAELPQLDNAKKDASNRQELLRKGGGMGGGMGNGAGPAASYFGRETAAASRAVIRAYYRQLGLLA